MKRIWILCLICLFTIVQTCPIVAQEQAIEDVEEVIEENNEQRMEENNEESYEDIEVEEEITNIDGLDENLFEQYVDSILHPSYLMMYNSIVDSIMDPSKPEYEIYQAWKTMISNVANGEQESSIFVYEAKDTPIYVPILDINMNRFTSSGSQYSTISCFVLQLLGYLQVECPYELYWFDKVSGSLISHASRIEEKDGVQYLRINKLTIKMRVIDEFSQTGQRNTTDVDKSKTGAALNAVNTAMNVVYEASSKEDYEKLEYYRDFICDAVSYDHQAGSASDAVYNNPWQLIYVFDNDPTTNVVCEGYAKAFQYLCDLTYFNNSSIHCLTVYGKTSGNHMWNILTMEDQENYIVDLTSYEAANIHKDMYWIGCATGSIEEGYQIYKNHIQGNFVYRYDETVKANFGSYLFISSTPYGQKKEETINPTSIELSKSSMQLQLGLGSGKLQVSLLPENSVEELVFTSSNTAIAKVNQEGVITPIKEGTCRIKVSTKNHLSVDCDIVVKDEIHYYIEQGNLRITGTGLMNDWQNVEDIPWFEQRESIQDVYIEDGIESIGTSFVASLPNLKRMYIPSSVTNIQEDLPDSIRYFVHENSYSDTVLNSGQEKIYVDDSMSVLEGYSVTLDEQIGFQYYLDINEVATFDINSYMNIQYPDGSVEVIYTKDAPTVTVDGKTYSVFRANISAKDLCQPISMTFYDQFGSKDYTYSFQDYANAILENYEEESIEVKTVKALLTYGYYAQTYFQYHIDQLPSLCEELKSYEFEPYTLVETNESLDFVGARLQLASTLNLKLYFIGEDIINVDGNDVSLIEEGKYKVLILPIYDIQKTYILTSDDFYLEYGPLHYGYSIKNEDLMHLMQALVSYYSLFQIGA